MASSNGFNIYKGTFLDFWFFYKMVQVKMKI